MTIDLLQLAKQVEETYYKDIELSFGKMVRVYHVPDVIAWKYKPDRPAPVRPKIKMKTATGVQSRLAKEGDPEFYEWQKEQEAYDEERINIQAYARYVLALKDVPYPDISEPPPNAKDHLNGHYPDNEMLRKGIWLDHTLLARRSDKNLVFEAIITLNGMGQADAGAVGEIKKNSGLSLEEED